MSKTKSRFHYTDDKDLETTPEKAVRITMLSFDQNEKVCNHCFLVVANKDHSCIRCDPSFPIPQEARDE